MEKLILEIPDEVLISLKETPAEFSRDLRILAAIKLYQMGKLSTGLAARLAGMTKVSFLQSLAGYNVPIFNLSSEEIRRDLDNA